MPRWNTTTNAEVSGELPEVSGRRLVYETLSQQIIGCALLVQRALGPSLLESTYQACLVHELRKAGLRVEVEVPIDLVYDSLRIERAYRLDLRVEGKIVVELKTVDRLLDAHLAQVFTYLRFSGDRLGILLNFWAWPMREGGIKRILNPGTRSSIGSESTNPSP